MRWRDKHSRPRPLEQVFAEHQARVERRLEQQTSQLRRRLKAEGTTGDQVITRGNCSGGGTTENAMQESAPSQWRIVGAW